VIERLAAAGFEIDKDGADDPHRRNVYFIDPNGIEVEFVEYSSDLPAQRNLSS
jgi:catechol 2,3-dioxygenase-like lactoylglutathione lyase family enzyme